MEVICGTYEALVLGFNLNDKEFDISFTDHSHTGNVKTVAVSDSGILATGSSDETIHLFNLQKRKEIGSLVHHEGSISSLKFHGKAHLFSASEDGTIVIWKIGSWESLRTLRGHKEAVYDISIHPSGKLALSISKDKTMRTWNLINGKCAYVTNIKTIADHVYWMPNGERYIICADKKLDVYGVQSGQIEHSINMPLRINALAFIEDGTMVLGGEGGMLYLYNTEDYTKQYEFSTETVRIKGIHCCECPDKESIWLVTGSADGQIKLWKLKSVQGKWSHSMEASTDCKFRITSMSVKIDRNPQKNIQTNEKKRKKKVNKTSMKTSTNNLEFEMEEDNEDVDTDEDVDLLRKKESSTYDEMSEGSDEDDDSHNEDSEEDLEEKEMDEDHEGPESDDFDDSEEEDVVIPKKPKMSNGKKQKIVPQPKSAGKKPVNTNKNKRSKQKKKNKKH